MLKVMLFLLVISVCMAYIQLRPVECVKFYSDRFVAAMRRGLDVATNLANEDEFESLLGQGTVPKQSRVFLINGWRWHTMSVIRDIERFAKLAEVSQHSSSSKRQEYIDRLYPAYRFAFLFNWRSLRQVEREVFFPWLKQLLPAFAEQEVAKIAHLHDEVQILCDQLNIAVTTATQSSTAGSLEKVQDRLYDLASRARAIQEIQENKLVPLVAAYVDSKEQESFNRRVILGLGLLNSQIHLVSMYDAIKDKSKEMEMFRSQIPRFAQLTLPIWRSRFYAPKASCLELD